MASVVLVDNTTFSTLGKWAADSNSPQNLNTLYSPDYRLSITSTVQGEATSDLSYAKDALVNSWINSGIATGQISIIATP